MQTSACSNTATSGGTQAHAVQATELHTMIEVERGHDPASRAATPQQRPVAPSTPEWQAAHLSSRGASVAGSAPHTVPSNTPFVPAQEPASMGYRYALKDTEVPSLDAEPVEYAQDAVLDAIGLHSTSGTNATIADLLHQSMAQSPAPAVAPADPGPQAQTPNVEDQHPDDSSINEPVASTMSVQVLNLLFAHKV
jgi:hypothetical protein